ncbi:MAG: hypothetical protein Q8Q62_06915 [Mesorhizobium sp.]|nr:hypothetical protein [Mesorhizobium sp.]
MTQRSTLQVLTSPAAICLMLLAASLIKFWAWTPTAFFGDDLNAYLKFVDGPLSTLERAVFDHWAQKHRPVVHVLYWAMFKAFNDEYQLHIAVCYAIHVACAFVFYQIALELSGRRVLVALAAALLFATVRFAYFDLILIGLVESVALFFFLLAMKVSLRLYDEAADVPHPVATAMLVVLLCALAMFSHERYIAAAPWTVAVIFLAPRLGQLGIVRRGALALAVLLPVALNIGYKMFFVGRGTLVGTGGKALGIDFALIAQNIREGIPSLFGINSGHPFWVGHVVNSVRDPALWFSLVFILGFLAVTASVAMSWRSHSQHKRVWVLLLVPLAGLMLVPPLMTVPFQPRWLFLQSGILFLILAWVYGEAVVQRRPLVWAMIAVCFAAYFAADLVISRDYRTMYLVNLTRMTGALAKLAPSLPPGRVDTIGAQNSWATLRGQFFKVYGGEAREMGYYATKELWLADPAANDTAWQYDDATASFTEVRR